ncbi:MAG: hypothetical protein MJ237_09290 [bacterium]|nr:hypothetical protein [bacterium]
MKKSFFLLAINGAKFNSNLNHINVNFEGKKDKNNVSRSVTNTIKAVPLAVLLAMSPLKTTDVKAQNLIIVLLNPNKYIPIQTQYNSEKIINDKFGKYIIKPVKDSKTGNYRISVRFSHYIDDSVYAGFDGYVTDINAVTYRFYDDRNKRFDKMTFNEAVVSCNVGKDKIKIGITKPEVTEYIKTLSDQYNNIIKTNSYDHNIKLMPSGVPDYEQVDASWEIAAKKNPETFGKPMHLWEINTSDGIYKVIIYSNDKNTSDFEEVSIQKGDKGPVMRVSELIDGFVNYSSNSYEVKQINFNQINVTNSKVGTFTINNKELQEFLQKLCNVDENNSKIPVKTVHTYHNNVGDFGVFDIGDTYTK